MSSLAERFFRLSPEQRRSVHLVLCAHALEVWSDYVGTTGTIRYIDSVVGMEHELELELPEAAFRAAREGWDLGGVRDRYAEPIVALQDDDLELPDHIRLAYYSIYNLYQKYALGTTIDDWLIVNQALSAETEEWRWFVLLEGALDAAL